MRAGWNYSLTARTQQSVILEAQINPSDAKTVDGLIVGFPASGTMRKHISVINKPHSLMWAQSELSAGEAREEEDQTMRRTTPLRGLPRHACLTPLL